MNTHRSRKSDWPRKVSVGRASVSIYKRTAPNGSPCFMVANYAAGKRRFDSYADEALALEAAGKLARQMSECEVVAASLTNDQAAEFAAAVQKLKPFNVGLLSAADAVANALLVIGGFESLEKLTAAATQGQPIPGLAELTAAATFYRQRHKKTTPKRVADVVAELLTVKAARGASERYLQDLRARLNRFAEKFQKNIGDVTTADVQSWLDTQKKLAPQTHVNFRRVVHLLFKFAVARGFATENPVDGVERVKVRSGEIEIFTPAETRKLLAAATPDFLPCLAIGAFAGLRSAEIERLDWRDVDLKAGHIIVGADKAKTAARRIVPVAKNLSAWLATTPQSKRTGSVWAGTHDDFYDAQQETAKAAGVAWKANALRHSCASYMFALSNDAGRVAGFLGNSAAVVHRHYREIVKPAAAKSYFSIKPAGKVSAPAVTSATPAPAMVTLSTTDFEPDLNADWIKHANPEATARDRAAGERAGEFITDNA